MEASIHDTGQFRVAEEQRPTVSAVGMPGSWYVAIVKRNSEKVVRDQLLKEGLEAYVATQTMMRRYAKRRPKSVEYVRIPAKVFLRIKPLKNSQDRSAFFTGHPQISSFMPDRAKSGRDWAVVPDQQMITMRRILDDPDNEVTFGYPDDSYLIGSKVRAIGGPIDGLEGFVASRGGKNYFCIEINGLDWAKVCISKEHLEPLE